jgi:hypothetical protein
MLNKFSMILLLRKLLSQLELYIVLNLHSKAIEKMPFIINEVTLTKQSP